MRRCPYCKEEIHDEAIKCKHCGSMLRGQGTDTLDAAVTIGGEQPSQQYDTLDAAATQGREATILGNQYRILKKIGEGGMGVVYLAEDIEMRNRPVAIKVLPPLLSTNRRAVENLRDEAVTTIRLNHPNIVRLHGFHSEGDLKFLVMEYIYGQTLEEKIFDSPSRKLILEETIDIAEKIAAALDYAHAQKPPVIHRDLKPSNIIIGKSGSVKVLDFGVAREIKDSYTRVTGRETSGTLPYMSPEQLRGKKPSASMDIYALGVVCYECLSSHPPFYTGELTYQVLHEEPEVLEGALSHVNGAVQKALAKDPAERPQTAGALIELLRTKVAARGESEKWVGAARKEGRELPLAVAPFREEQAREYQKLTAEVLDVPIGKTIELDGGIKMEFVLIPSGEFDMGSPSSEKDRDNCEGQVHKVKISRPFYMGIYEVTQAQWNAVMGTTISQQRDKDSPSRPLQGEGTNYPMYYVSWEEAVEFCKKLNQREGKRYRLPTEAEWEYACRAGTQTRFYFGDDESSLDAYTWHVNNSDHETHPVGQKKANAFGLYDMYGNVWEWCSDWYDEDYCSNSPSVDPKGPNTGTARVLREGAWDHPSRYCRSAARGGLVTVWRDRANGFRVVVLPD